MWLLLKVNEHVLKNRFNFDSISIEDGKQMICIKNSRTRGHEVILEKDQCRLDIRKYSFSQRTINEWNKLSTDHVNASSVNMFKNKVDKYVRKAGYTEINNNCWPLDKTMASLSTCSLGVFSWMAISLNLAKCFLNHVIRTHGESTHQDSVLCSISHPESLG